MSRWYLDSSVALHVILPGGDARARAWLDEVLASGEPVHSSTLLSLELNRVLRREQLDLTLARLMLDRVDKVSINDGVLQLAATIEPHVKSLDAIHLATCLLLGEGVSVVSHDAGMQQVAAQLGLDTLDPLGSTP